MSPIYEAVKERMLRYARINTRSERYAGVWPTSACQRDLGRMLQMELEGLGLQDVFFDEPNCVVYAKIPENAPGTAFGLIAHMDTAPDAPGSCSPWVLENYDGGDIVLNETEDIVMRAADYPNLKPYIGQDLILTDGTTLLGGDDKASIAAIMTFAEQLMQYPELPHPEIALAFTPDEEVGGLAHTLDLERFGVQTAYTLDGDHLGYYEDETFNASAAKVEIKGVSVHTGTAKGIMKNAVDIAAQFMAALPAREKPQYTDGVQGFFHVLSCEASCEYAVLQLIIRDFDAKSFRLRELFLKELAEGLNRQYGEGTAKLTLTPQYRNMKEVLKEVPFTVEKLRQAIEDSGLTPVCEPFRGGTDGAALSFRGLPCPNLSAGYENAHGRFEYVPIQSMEKNVEILLRLAALYTE